MWFETLRKSMCAFFPSPVNSLPFWRFWQVTFFSRVPLVILGLFLGSTASCRLPSAQAHSFSPPFWQFQTHTSFHRPNLPTWFQMTWEGQFFSAQSLLDHTGQTISSPDWTSYQQRGLGLWMSTEKASPLTFYGHVHHRWIQIYSQALSGTAAYWDTQSLGVSWNILTPFSPHPSSIRPQPWLKGLFQGDLTVFQLKPQGVMPDRNTQWTLACFGAWPLWSNPPSGLWAGGGLGYQMQSASQSSHLPGSLFLEWKLENAWFRLGAGGQFSLLTEASPFPQASEGLLQQGFPRARWIDLAMQAGYLLSKAQTFTVHWEQPVTGTSFIKGSDIRLSLSWALFSPSPLSTPARERESYSRTNQGFAHYSLSAKILEVQDTLHLVKIDQGSEEGLLPGDRLDLFELNAHGDAQKAMARCRVLDTKPQEAVLEVLEYYQGTHIEPGFIAKKWLGDQEP